MLHAACRLGLTDIAQLLLEHGADPHVRDAHGRTPELVALDLGHADCAGLFYNVDIHSYAPKQSGADDGSTSDEENSAEGAPYENNGHRGDGGSSGSRSGIGGGDDDNARENQEGEGEGEGARESGSQGREGPAGDGDEQASSSIFPREGYADAFAASRRASTMSMRAEEQVERSQQRASGKSSAWDGGAVEASQIWTNSAQNALFEGGSGAGKPGEDLAEMLVPEGHEGEGIYIGNVNADEAGTEWEWSETEGWVRARDGGSSDPDELQARPLAALDEENQDRAAVAAATITTTTDYNNEGYHDESGDVKEPHPSDSYSGWEHPYYSAAHGDVHGGSSATQKQESYDGVYQGDNQQYQHDGSGRIGDGSYIAAYGGGGSDSNTKPPDRRDSSYFQSTTWEDFDHGSMGPPQQKGEVVSGGGDNNQELLGAELSAGWPLPEAMEGQQQEGEASVSQHVDDVDGGGGGGGDEHSRNAGAAANHDDSNNYTGYGSDDGREEPEYETVTTLENSNFDGSDARNTENVGAVAVVKAKNLWLSKLDESSGSVYYQNERSGLTQWDMPEGDAVVVDAEPAEQ